MLRSNYAPAPQLLSLRSRALEPQLLSLRITATEVACPAACAPRQEEHRKEKHMHCNQLAPALRNLGKARAAMKTQHSQR